MKTDQVVELAVETHAEWVAEHVRACILDGRIAAGTRVNEVHLSRELAVSRTPIRGALQLLAGEGLLLYVANKGFTVRRYTQAEIVDAYEMRALAEGLAARRAAEHGVPAALQNRLEEALAGGDHALAQPGPTDAQRRIYGQMNEIFHEAIFLAAQTPLVGDVIRLCQRVPQAIAHNIVAFDLPDVRRRHAAHHRIYRAVIARDPKQAEAAMRQHVLNVKASMMQRLSAVAAATPATQAANALASEAA